MLLGWDFLRSRLRPLVLKADLGDLAVAAHKPPMLRIGEGHAPHTRHATQCVPGVTFVRSPGCASGVSSNNDRTIVVAASMTVTAAPVVAADPHIEAVVLIANTGGVLKVCQPEDRPGYRGSVGQRP